MGTGGEVNLQTRNFFELICKATQILKLLVAVRVRRVGTINAAVMTSSA